MIHTQTEVRRLYPALADLDDRVFAATMAQAQVVALPAGT